MLGIQQTIAICYEWHDEFKGNMPKSVEYAIHVYTDPHRYQISLWERLYPELRSKPSLLRKETEKQP